MPSLRFSEGIFPDGVNEHGKLQREKLRFFAKCLIAPYDAPGGWIGERNRVY